MLYCERHPVLEFVFYCDAGIQRIVVCSEFGEQKPRTGMGCGVSRKHPAWMNSAAIRLSACKA